MTPLGPGGKALGRRAPAGAKPGQQTLPWPQLENAEWPKQGGGEKDAAVIVAIEDYAFLPDVQGAVSNAKAWQKYFIDARSVPRDRVLMLLNADGSRAPIENAIDKGMALVESGGTLWFVFIGHGAPNKKSTRCSPRHG